MTISTIFSNSISLGLDIIPKKVKEILSTLKIESVDKKELGHEMVKFDSGYIIFKVTVLASGILFKDTIEANKNLIKVDKVKNDFGAAIEGSFKIIFKGKEWAC